MSVEDEKKKARKAPAKKAVSAPSTDVTDPKKVKAAATKPAAPKKKPAAKIVAEATTEQPRVDAMRRDVQPTHIQIAERAHHYFVERGRQHGFHEQDWLRAERELRSRS